MQPPFLLCLSTNAELRETRRSVLLTRYRVTAIGSVTALKTLPNTAAFDLLVLCHTLSEGERTAAIQFARECWTGIKILGISAPYASGYHGEADAVVGGLSGPLAMFEAITHLLPPSGAAQR